MIFAPRALSMMSSDSPISQWGLRDQVAPPAGASAPTSPSTGDSRASISPQVRTVTLASSPPTGTSGSAGFGMRSSSSSTADSTSESSASIAEIRSPAATDRALSSETSELSGAEPPLIASPIRFEAAFRSALRASLSPSSCRRRASASSARSTTDGSSPLSTAPLRMTSGSSRSRCRPTLMPPLRSRRRPPWPARSQRPCRGWPAASPRAARSVGRGRRGRSPRTHVDLVRPLPSRP